MMYTLKGSYAVMMLLLFTQTYGDLFRHAEQQQYNPVIPLFPWYLAPSQEFMLREIILESVIPSPFKAIHKRPLDASFYSGPVATMYSSDDINIILSSGNVYRPLNGHWMLCEDGCIDCEPCATQGNPLFKWILQKIKQPSVPDPSLYDFQLTIISQTNDHFYTSNFWPNSYIYVTPQGKRGSISITRAQHDNGSENFLPNLKNSFSQQHHQSKNLWRLTERDSLSQKKNHIQENASTNKSLEQKSRFRNMKHQPWFTEKTNQLAPKLILGTDQQGQKHLIHVVSVDNPINTAHLENVFASNHSISSHFAAGQARHLNNTISKYEKQTYQQIFRRVFDSLNTHRQSIESFLELPTDNVREQRIASSMDNMEVAEFSWNNRDINHTNINFKPLRLNDTLLSFYITNKDKIRKHQQYKNNYGYQHINPDVNDYYRYKNVNHTSQTLRSQLPINFDFDRERQKVRIRPYFINSKNISKINLSVLLQSLDNSSIDAIPKLGFNNGFINFAKQIDLNETIIDKANNNSIESITIKRENKQAFNSKKLASGDANRQFKTLHYAFKIITTELPIIQKRHKTLNPTAALQINTSKIFANN